MVPVGVKIPRTKAGTERGQGDIEPSAKVHRE